MDQSTVLQSLARSDLVIAHFVAVCRPYFDRNRL